MNDDLALFIKARSDPRFNGRVPVRMVGIIKKLDGDSLPAATSDA